MKSEDVGPLYKRYRPKTFEEVIGNKSAITNLQIMLKKPEDKRPRSFLLTGPSGTGKTTLARIIASALGCVDTDFTELDSASFRGIDQIRDIRSKSQFKPTKGGCRIFFIDECHKLSSDAMSALLKALEDTPSHVYYILATTDPQKLLLTVRNRCTQYTMTVLSDSEMLSLLKSIVKKEGQKLEQEIYDQIIQDSQGHPRNALQILDQVLAADGQDRLAIAKRSAESTNQIIDLCRALLSKSNWKTVAGILKGLKEEEPESIRRVILGYFSAVLLNGENNRAACILDEFMSNTYDSGMPMITWNCYKIVKS